MENHIENSLKIVIILTLAFFIVEVVGALVSGSLSLMGDAGHMFRDVFALFISLSAIKIAKKLPTKTKTFGYHRIEILAVFLNGIFPHNYKRVDSVRGISKIFSHQNPSKVRLCLLLHSLAWW
ncbi:hypothetical protein DRN72_04905 [Methanosarcinales archaeon]|nr:MAG: hypothetical protein DRH15_12450 [Deltaproteobacteria bacterium]RLG20622.1 MAG: hypothetical protein DRN72_04905 [Methanosarcinales archaeon]